MSQQSPKFNLRTTLRGMAALAIVFALAAVLTPSACSQTFQVLHTFSGGDGQLPYAGLTMDAAGRLYGNTCGNYTSTHGTVFKLTPSGSSWVLTTLYTFSGGSDGACPQSRVIFGPEGRLYGTTTAGGDKCQICGTVFSLRPPLTVCKTALCPWTETILYAFSGYDGVEPMGDLNFDGAGNLYGTAYEGGMGGRGNVYELTPTGGGWTENVIFDFPEYGALGNPSAGVMFDKAGNLYGTAESDYGGVFELTPSGGGWLYSEIYTLHGGIEGSNPRAGVIFDNAGNIYSATTRYGVGGGGTIFGLTPSDIGWVFSGLYSFVGTSGPLGNLFMDAAGNFYGTTFADGAYGLGSVFKLSPGPSGWTYTSLHDFTGGDDGANPVSNVLFDAAGNLYGTASAGGNKGPCFNGCGVVWEIMP
jgi:uncharacterized repeat protein (TIGR03803 family)